MAKGKTVKKSERTGPLGLAGTEAAPSGKRWSVGKVWTPKLAKRFTPVSCYFIDNYYRLPYPITAIEFLLIVHLLRYKWDEAMPFPAMSTLAKKMLRSEAAVRAAARSLEKKGYLKRHMRLGRPNHFDLVPLFEAVEKLHATDAATAAAGQAKKSYKDRKTA